MNNMADLPPPTSAPAVTTYDARDLINGETQVCILLDNHRYFLRITRAGKLILTK